MQAPKLDPFEVITVLLQEGWTWEKITQRFAFYKVLPHRLPDKGPEAMGSSSYPPEYAREWYEKRQKDPWWTKQSYDERE